ncbi:hypothetical protein MACJ_000113 [Theileria orientalis]|uniref:Rad50/SbcC-type AAA domain-containing protein n=1 Tax=Theileria orientalis TaxID=68886 RepID=A0A976QQ91_THEOR|nr:hypothetical protein MACJ_000113 [Theileria orientalis]
MDSPQSFKRRRKNPVDSGIGGVSSIPPEFENTSGKIIKVTLLNFLNHAHLTFNCSPYLNLIFGRNGQGKSAIVQGIALCFGATGHSVGRDASLNHYIKDYHLKNGPSCAKIELHLSNHGANAYNNVFYGDVIIVSRTIYKNGSTYYLGGLNIRKSPVDRKTLNQYLRHIKMNINNPTTYMDQEMCKSFFFQSSAQSFYKYYSSCAGLDKMEEKINSEKKNLEDCKEELKIRKRVLEPDQKKLESLSNQIESFEGKLNEWKSAKESYKLALYKESKEHYETCKNKCEKFKENNPTEKVKRLEETVFSLEEELGKLKKEIDVLLSNSLEQKDKIRNTSDTISTCEDSIKELKSSMVSVESNISQVESDLKRLGTEKTSEVDHHKESEELKKKLEIINGDYERLQDNYQSLMSELTSYEDDNNEIEIQMKQVKIDMDELKRDMDTLKSTAKNNTVQASRRFLYKYDPNSVREAIRKMKSKNLFIHEPIGPVGEYLKVVPNVSSWKVLPIIERHLKKFLLTWLVSTEQDRIALQNILMEHGCDMNNIKITKTNLFTCKTDIVRRTQMELSGSPFDSIMFNFLSVKDIPAVLMSILIDSFNISKTGICKDEKEMVRVLNDEKLRVTAAYTLNNLDFGKRLNGSLFMTPSYDKNPYNYKFVRYSNQEQLDLISESKQRLSECRAREEKLRKYSSDLNSKLSSNRKRITATRSKLNSLRSKKTDLITIRTRIESDLNNQVEIEKMLQDADSYNELLKYKQNYTEQLESLKQQMKDYEDKLDSVLKEKTAHEATLREQNVVLDTILSEISQKKMSSNKLLSSINSNKNEIKAMLRDSITYKSTLADYVKDAEDALKEVNKQEKDLQDSGIDFSGPLPPKKSQEYLKIVNSSREVLSSIVDSSRNVETHLENLKLKYREAHESFRDKQAKLAETQSNYSRQKANYTSRIRLFDEYRLRMEKLAKLVFKQTLDAVCGYDGSLIFNDVKRTLDIHILNKQQSYDRAHTLSGGEQSSIQLSMIHSLASLSFSPIHMFDEIDVYMDESTRIRNVNAIVQFASNNRDRQFFLLTPHMEFAKHVSGLPNMLILLQSSESHPDIAKLFNVAKSPNQPS